MMSTIADRMKRALANALKQVIAPAIGACVVGYFVYYAVHGDRGLIAVKHLQAEIQQAKTVLAEVHGERERMEIRARRMRADHLDRDMLDEQVRAMLNMTHPDDVIIQLPPMLIENDPPAGRL